MTRGDWDYDGVQDLVACSFKMRNLDLGINNVGGCFAFYGRKTGVGGFETNLNYRVNFGGLRQVPRSNAAYFNTRLEGIASNFGSSVLLMDLNNYMMRSDLMIGEPMADNFGGPSNLGTDSGRVSVIRDVF